MNLSRSAAAALLLFVLTGPARAQSSVGSGGDVLAAFLTETRIKLRETATRILGADAQEQKRLCRDAARNPAQTTFCRQFLLRTLERMVDLHLTDTAVPFEIVTEPLYAPGPDGEPMRVAAKTLSGPEGNIRFDQELVSGHSPRLLLALLVHETGHKVTFSHKSRGEERRFVLDNDPVGPFATGRELLDTAGLAVAGFAVKHQLIGESFSIRDRFKCTLFFDTSDGRVPVVELSGEDTRSFVGDGGAFDVFDEYAFGVGPGHDFMFNRPEGETCISFRLLVEESAGCEEDTEERATHLSLWRHFPPRTEKAPELIHTRTVEGVNPACDSGGEPRPFEMDYRDVIFQCAYTGSSASTRLARTNKTRIRSACP